MLDTDVPKLMFWADPGTLISPERAAWYASRLKACSAINLGPGLHYLQEDHAEAIGRETAAWLAVLG